MLDIFTLMRNWFNWCFDNPDLINPNHTALYMFCIEHNNRMGWKTKYGLPTTMAMEAIGIKSYNTYKKTFDDLIKFKFIILIEKSQNQYSSNIIALSIFDKALDKALDKATAKHTTKQVRSTIQSTGESNDSIDIHNTIIPNTEIQNTEYIQTEKKEFEFPSENPKNKPASKTKKMILPNLNEVIDYFKENGYSEAAAKKAFEYYEAAKEDGKWFDAHGSQVLSWKQKMRGVWFKPENLIKKQNEVPAFNKQQEFSMQIAGPMNTFMGRCEAYKINHPGELPPQEWYDKFNLENGTDLKPK